MKQRVAVGCLMAAALNSAALAQAKFSTLGRLSGGPHGAIPQAVTADGTAVTGLAGTPTGLVAFLWTAAKGMRALPHSPAGLTSSLGYGLSDDGRIVVGIGTTASLGVAIFWDDRGAHLLPDLPGGLDDAAAIDVTPDGRVVVGCGFDASGRVAARWIDGRPESLAVPGQMRVGVATDLTPDGSRIVGIGGDDPEEAEGFVWINGTVTGIGDVPGGRTYSQAVRISRAGNVVVGLSAGENSGFAFAVRWSAPTGLVNLGDVPGGHVGSAAVAVSADGRFIGGYSFTERGVEAMIWDPAHGMRSLPVVLETRYGLNLKGWKLRTVADMTPDGGTLVGEALAPDGSHLEPYLVHMPAYCYPDCNADDTLTVADLTCFMGRYAVSDYMYADCDNDDRLTLADFGCFTTKFALGCP